MSMVELIVAFALGGVVLSMVAGTLIAQRRSERATVDSGGAAADEVIAVMTAVLSRLSRDDTLTVRGDTAIDLRLIAGIALPCAGGGDSLVFSDDGLTGWWESEPDSGDVVELAYDDGWHSATVIRARTHIVTAGACSGTQRVVTLGTPLGRPEVPLARISRPARFMVYRGGEGGWWFGERLCDGRRPPVCGAAQPIAGPLSGPRALRFAIDSTHVDFTVSVDVVAGSATRSTLVPLPR
jgi:hypothetical protein